MEQNKIRTYIFYAFGEIALVMIGILLALQVNNWNEDRLAREYETKVLQELRNAAFSDSEYITNHLVGNRGAARERAIAYFDRVLLGENAHPDSVSDHFPWIYFSDSFQYNIGPYESIKSTGLDKISNDSLRAAIAHLYDFMLPREKELIYWRTERFEEEAEKREPLLREPPRPVVVNGEVQIRKPFSVIDYRTNIHFLELLREAKGFYYWNQERYIEVAAELRKLVDMIDRELDSSK